MDWSVLTTPLGPLTVVADSRGVHYVVWGDGPLAPHPPAGYLAALADAAPHAASAEAGRADGTPADDARRVLTQALTELSEYFAGTRQEFTVPLAPAPESFRTTARRALCTVPYGTTVSYGELATLAKNPRASRAAGTACATNPIVVIIPCHRVVRADGSLGHYTGGTHIKEWLLALEAAPEEIQVSGAAQGTPPATCESR